MRSLDKDLGLDAEALAVAKTWTFEPGTLKGEAVPVVITANLAFQLHEPR